MIFVDTGYFLAALDPSAALHERATARARGISEQIATSEYVLWETINTLSSPSERPRAARAVEMGRGGAFGEFLPASDDLFQAGWSLFLDRPDKDWSLIDCVSFHVMRVRGINRALAHDQDFEQAGFESLPRRSPR